MKKLFFSLLAVAAVVTSTFALAPKGTTIYCSLSNLAACDVAFPDKAISAIPTGEQGRCVAVQQSTPCPLVNLVDQP